MNHLRDLLESLEKGVSAPSSSSITFDELDSASDWCVSVSERAVAFFGGDINSVAELQIVAELVRLPFPTCWFEFELHPARDPGVVCFGGLLMDTLDDGSYQGQVWIRGRNGWKFFGQISGAALQPEKWRLVAGSYGIAQGLGLFAKACQSFLSALHCSNVQRQVHTPAEKLQKARMKRGKAPLFSYWTLQLNGKSERGDSQGGTHASPRVHLRRGHPRQFSPGKWTWVQACAVGNKAAGMVHKDYKAGPSIGRLAGQSAPGGIHAG